MDATKVERGTFQGQFIDERTDIDHATRLRGAEQVRDLIGLDAPRKAEGSGETVVIPIILADFARPRARVIDAEVREIKGEKPVADGSVGDSGQGTKDVTDAQVPVDVDAEIIEPDLEEASTPTPQSSRGGARGGPTVHGR